MGAAKQQQEQKRLKNAQGSQKTAKNAGGSLLSFTPNEPQKMAVKHLVKDFPRVMDAVSRICARGAKVTLGAFNDGDSFYAIAREVADDWQKARAVSAVHRDLDMAMACLAYACEDVYPGFPDCTLPATAADLDW